MADRTLLDNLDRVERAKAVISAQFKLDCYKDLTNEQIKERILQIKAKLGKKLLILTHHYQRQDIVEIGDYRGDSFILAKVSRDSKEAQYIVFCGVHFMAESAEILRGEHQVVYHPNLHAGCPMADMASGERLETSWQEINSILPKGQKIVPITYMNSWAELKAFCGKYGGSVCTSSNALKIFKWAFNSYDKILFFPDEHLGRNISKMLGIPKNEVVLWDRKKLYGGLTFEQLSNAKVILWNGYCHVHRFFTLDMVKNVRNMYPDAKVIVHPECVEEVVDNADFVGSTEALCKYVAGQPSGSKIFIGTEINLVSRLAYENPDKMIKPLGRSLCHNMYKIDLPHVLWTLENLHLDDNVVKIPLTIKEYAKEALERMIAIATA
jgi:quinolinate synthase